ncbi:hypothetical protein [Aquimarina atlantica]|uniref:hypothetical protein n=1 Tax=Aquimarina atlantica TaxID=1317122 RepID=UPI001969C478|nr:hypothetical protein [Aquimarina atlantica]
MTSLAKRHSGSDQLHARRSRARTAYWNTKVGGVSNSSHKIPTCKAVDIHMPNKPLEIK